MGIRTDLLVTEEIVESSDLRATPFEFERAKRVEAALSILEGKWKIVILNRLFARPIWRFSELERAVPGISQRMLSQQLRLLEKCELVTQHHRARSAAHSTRRARIHNRAPCLILSTQ
jgi:DNA-binding HxlR family transcriptional regulator